MSSDDPSTKPTIETVLERINVLGHQFHTELESFRESVAAQLSEVKETQEKLRADFNAALRRVERKVEILNDNILSVRADHRDIVVRFEQLESKVS